MRNITRYMNKEVPNKTKRPLYLLIILLSLASCSKLIFWKKPLNEEKAAFTLFDPFLTSQVKKMGENKDWCFGFRQVIRPTMPWYACFIKQESALRCYQKVSRLQRHLRQKKPKGELYRPGEIVELHYIKRRKEYLNRVIFPDHCLALKIKNRHLLREKKGLENWRVKND